MGEHKKVMIVDDEEGVRLSFDRYLSEHGFDVTTAEDGEKAFELIESEVRALQFGEVTVLDSDGNIINDR